MPISYFFLWNVLGCVFSCHTPGSTPCLTKSNKKKRVRKDPVFCRKREGERGQFKIRFPPMVQVWEIFDSQFHLGFECVYVFVCVCVFAYCSAPLKCNWHFSPPLRIKSIETSDRMEKYNSRQPEEQTHCVTGLLCPYSHQWRDKRSRKKWPKTFLRSLEYWVFIFWRTEQADKHRCLDECLTGLN